MADDQGFQHFPGALDRSAQLALVQDVHHVLAEAPLYFPAMPRTGKLLSVRMTNCGALGWLTDKAGGYRYEPHHPATGRPWPPIPERLLAIWSQYGHYPAPPEACLINVYAATAKLGSHRDEDELDKQAPVVSVSLGDDAVFHVGGVKRTDSKTRMTLKSGDIVVLGGAARMAYHGIDKVLPGTSDLLAEGGRINLTLRRVTVPTASSRHAKR
ncbi:MAG: alpha-ketoglutarate-dependent dioxygenase AlkB family protein [Hyphomicrobiaceae bacterium]